MELTHMQMDKLASLTAEWPLPGDMPLQIEETNLQGTVSIDGPDNAVFLIARSGEATKLHEDGSMSKVASG